MEILPPWQWAGDYGPAWLLADYLAMVLVRVLPEKKVKRMLAGGFGKVISAPAEEKDEWLAAVQETFDHDLTFSFPLRE